MIVDANKYVIDVKNAGDYIKSCVGDIGAPSICIVLGSGLAPLADMCEVLKEIPYSSIPGFPLSTAPGHAGKLIVGKLSGKLVYMMSGRFHYYEGYDLSVCTFYVRVMSYIGVDKLFLTNAAGGIADGMKPAQLMVITDHISFFADSALRGANLEEFGVRFPDQSNVYDEEYINILKGCASELGITLHEGTYIYSKGPQYETPAEIRAMKLMGASAVGMSTVPEAIVASHSGMRIAAVSCISNLAAGISPNKLSAEEVFENAAKASNDSCNLVKAFVAKV